MNILKSSFALIGLDVRWLKNVRAAERRAWEERWADSHCFLNEAGISTVLDIGANVGQFAKMISLACPGLKTLHSFEPLAECHAPLGRALSGDPRHVVHSFGFGDKDEKVRINRADFTPCSSLLRPKELLIRDHPGAGRIKEETIELRTLDNWASETNLNAELLIKIDVQGYEDRVISGGRNTLRSARFVLIEVPFVQLYENQPLFHDIYMMLHDLGFVYRGSTGQNIRKQDARALEADAVFERA